MQSKLLRVLQERVIRRVGGVKDIVIDVRVIAATNRNLQDKISTGQFREDLFYRLNVFPIHIPPLRQRSEDIPALAAYFLDSFSRSFNRYFSDVSPTAVRLMSEYSWPGNIRELRNVIERICIMRSGPSLLSEYLPQEIRGVTNSIPPPSASAPATFITLPPDMGMEDAVASYECAIIKQALVKSHSNVLQAAALLKIPRGTLRYKMDKYNLS